MVSGVPGTQGLLRFPFEPGWNAWKPKGPFRLETVVDLLASLLYPAPLRSNMLGPGKARQAGMTFQARGNIYRVMRDYARGTTQLAQLEPGTQTSFKELSRELRFIRETLARSARLPSQRVFRSFLVSRLSEALIPEERSDFVRMDEQVSKGDRAPLIDPESRLTGLQEELKTHRRIAELSARLDELLALTFKIDERLRELEEPRKRLAQLEREYDEVRIFDRPGVLQPQLVSKLRVYAATHEKTGAELAALEEDGIRWENELEGTPDRPWWREIPVAAGSVSSAAGFGGMEFFRDSTSLYALCWVAFFLGLVLVGYGLVSGRRRLEKKAELAKQVRGVEVERAGIEKRFDIETTAVRKFFDAVGNDDPEELLEMLERHAVLGAERKKAEEEFKALQAAIPEPELRKEKEEALAEIARIEQELGDLPPVTADVNSVAREVLKIEGELRAGGAAVEVSSPDFHNADDPNRLLMLAAEILGRSEAELLRQMKQGLEINLTSMTRKRFRQVLVQGGRVTGFRSAEGEAVAWERGDPSTRAALLFSVQFTLWQLASASGRAVPVVLDLLSSLSGGEDLRKLGLEVARVLATKTQVLVLGE